MCYPVNVDYVQPGGGRSPAGAALSRLELEDGPEELLGGGGEEADLGVGVQPVQHRRLRRQVVGDVAVVALRGPNSIAFLGQPNIGFGHVKYPFDFDSGHKNTTMLIR